MSLISVLFITRSKIKRYFRSIKQKQTTENVYRKNLGKELLWMLFELISLSMQRLSVVETFW